MCRPERRQHYVLGHSKLTPEVVDDLHSTVITVGVGRFHACALVRSDARAGDIVSGTVKCWRLDSNGSLYGQLGNGTLGPGSALPLAVPDLMSGVQSISAGFEHTCAVTGDTTSGHGAAKCWGSNQNGELGDGTTISRYTPTDVVGLSSSRSRCRRSLSQLRYCWRNLQGQRGSGYLGGVNQHIPTDVSGLTSGVQALTLGDRHSCALTGDTATGGSVKCWGMNDYGQLGDGTTEGGINQYSVSGLGSGVKAIAAGSNHTSALTIAGAVKCWGNDKYGQLGDGSWTTDQATPVDVVGLGSSVRAIAAGSDHTSRATGRQHGPVLGVRTRLANWATITQAIGGLRFQ